MKLFMPETASVNFPCLTHHANRGEPNPWAVFLACVR
jgi:hypothetical protein